jgi:toxin ParE1/3/4
MRNIIRKPRAIIDLIEEADYIARDSVDAAERLLLAAEETFELLAQMPGIGKIRRLPDPRVPELRQFPIKDFENWLVFYRYTDSALDVVRVLHGARDIDPILTLEDTTE